MEYRIMLCILIEIISLIAGSKDVAIELYRKGIAELEKGIEIEVHGNGEQWRKAQRINEKMIVNLEMSKERLEFLSMTNYLV